jgi:O-antigen/teichoic acid export membrane protein
VNLAALLLLAWSAVLTPTTAAIATVLSGAPLLLWSAVWVWKRYRPVFTQLAGAQRRLLSFGVRAHGAEVFGSVASQLDRIVLVAVFSPSLLGIYVVAMNLSRIVVIFSTAVVSVLLPKAAGRAPDDVITMVERAVSLCNMVMTLVVGCLILLGPYLLTFLYGEEFNSAATAFALLVVEAAITSSASILGQAFMALGRPGVVALLQGVAAGVSIVLLLLLAPTYGLVGACMALLLAALVRFALLYRFIGTRLGARAPRLWLPWREARGLIRAGLGRG